MLLALCCASLANAASDSEAMVDSAQYATYAASAHRPALGHWSGVRGDGDRAGADERRDRMQQRQQSPVPPPGQAHEGAAVGQD
jgi:hypothetical protein